MPDMVIARNNTLGGNQPKLITFTDKHVHIIGYIEMPVEGADSSEGEV